MAGKKHIGQASITVVPELKTDKAQKELDKLTKPKEVEIIPKINTQKVFGDMQKILDKQTKTIQDAFDFKNLANQMQGYIKSITNTVDKSLSGSLQATLDDFSERFSALSYQANDGVLIKGYEDAAIKAGQLLETSIDQNKILKDQGKQIEKNVKGILNMASAVKRFNKLMTDVGYDDFNVDYGSMSNAKNWNIRDLVSRAQMILDTYSENGHINYDLKSESEQGAKIWRSHTTKLKRFITSFEPFIDGIATTENHGSQYDNTPKIKQALETQEKLTTETKEHVRTVQQVTAELERERQALREIEEQQAKNDAAREKFLKKQLNYGKEVLGVNHAVYDTDLLKEAAAELNEFNELLATRNKFQEKYNKLCRMVENYYISDTPGKYGISNGIYNTLDQFVEGSASMRELDSLFEQGQNTTNKYINELFQNVIRTLRSEITTVSGLLSSGQVSGDMIGQRLNKEETSLNREQQRLSEEREARLTRINQLREEELNLIRQSDQEAEITKHDADENTSLDTVKAIEEAYDAASKRVDELRGHLSEAEKEQKRLFNHAVVYGYTLDMAAQKAGRIQNTLDKSGKQWTRTRAEAIPSMLSKGYIPEKYSDDYGLRLPQMASYTQITKTEYDYAQYLVKAIGELNLGWEKGLVLLRGLNGQLETAELKVIGIQQELAEATQLSEAAYERMAYAHSGILGDEAIAAKKAELSACEEERREGLAAEANLISLLHDKYKELRQIYDERKSLEDQSKQGDTVESIEQIIQNLERAKTVEEDILALNKALADIPDQYKKGLTIDTYKEYGINPVDANFPVMTLEEIEDYKEQLVIEREAAKNIVQLVDNYGQALDTVNNKLMQGTKLLNQQAQVFRLFHNSPEIFDRFDSRKSGTNQGQALGFGHYLALQQNGEFNHETYGRYQTQWYANVQNPFKVGDRITAEQANIIVAEFLANSAENFKQHMLSKLIESDVVEAVKDIASISKTVVGEVFGRIGYDAIMDGAQINVFDRSKIHRANNSVLDIGSQEFIDLNELQQKIWSERSIIENANRQIKELENQYSGKTQDELDFDLFMETLSKGWGWRQNVAKIASAFKELTGELPKSEEISEESMKALVENYEFSKQNLQGYQDAAKEHQVIVDGLVTQFEAQKAITDAFTQSYLAGDIQGIVNKESPVQSLEQQVETTENAVEATDKLTSSYEGLAEAVSKYVDVSKKLWDAYDSGKEFAQIAQERNAAIEQIVSLFPKSGEGIAAHLLQEGYSMYLQDQNISRRFANDGAESMLNSVETHLQQAETQLGAAIEENTQRKQEQTAAAAAAAAATREQDAAEKELKETLEGELGAAKEKVQIIQKSVDQALEQLRNAENNKNFMIDLSEVSNPDDLEGQIGNLIQKAFGADLTVGSVTIRDNIAQIGLYNEKLGITTQQVWELTKATEDAAEAQLEFVKAEPLVVNFKKAAQYAEAQAKAITQSNNWVNSQLGKLDTQERSYKYSNKAIDGSTKIENFDGTAEQYIGQTLDGLADNIRQRLLASVDTTITDEFKNSILNDLRILENEIKVQQYKEYASTTMTPTEIGEARKQFEYMLDSLEAKAKKNNVFSQLEDSLLSLRKRLTDSTVEDYVASGSDVGKFVDSLRTVKTQLNAAISNAGVAKTEHQALQNLLNVQERLYEAKKKYVKLEISGTANASDIAAAARKVEELQAQYDAQYLAIERSISSEQDYTAIKERELRLEDELTTVIREQQETRAQAQRQQQAAHEAQIQKQTELETAQYIKNEEDAVKAQYKSLLDIVNKINAVNQDILKYQNKDGGSGLFSKYISQLQAEKTQLVSELQNITNEINNSLSGEFVQGKEYTIPFSNILTNDNGAISTFLNDTKIQAALTTEEIERLMAALKSSQNIDVEAAAKVTEQFKSVQETYKQIMSLTNLDKNNINYQAIGGMYNDIIAYKNTLSSDPTQWSAEETAELQNLINNFTKYGNILVQVGQKEEAYFAGKKQYTADTTMSSMAEDAKKASETVGTAQQKLTEAAQKFAQESGASGAVITKFVTDANGISRLDFSVLDEGTNTMRKFSMEMGSVSQGIYVTENTINSSLSQIDKAGKQLGKVSDLIRTLQSSGINMDTSSIQKLLGLQKDLNAELAKGDNADKNKLSELTAKAQISYAEVNKLYKQWVQLQNAIESGDAYDLGAWSNTQTAAQELAKQTGYSVESIGKLNEATGKFKVTMKDAQGNIHEFTLNMKNLGNAVVAQETGLKEYTSWWDRLKSSVTKTGKQLATALVGANVFYKAIAELRKGYQYVKELDLALTELKKVTDETEGTYKRFLETASKTSSVIGSTVTDFTNATANFARLGYTIEQSAQMAEAAIVYKNVADGLDTVDEATESIISTMKANINAFYVQKCA